MRPERRLRRFLIHLAGQQVLPGSSVVCLSDDERLHLRTVLRLRVGDQIEVLDLDSRKVFGAEILSETTGEIRILSVLSSGDTSNITLLLGVGRPRTMDFIVEKCTELGIASFCLFQSARSQNKPSQKERDARGSRLIRVRDSALKQSKQESVPGIFFFDSLAEALASIHSKSDDPRQLRSLLTAPNERLGTPATSYLSALTSFGTPLPPRGFPTVRTTIHQSSQAVTEQADTFENQLEDSRIFADLFLIAGAEGGLTEAELGVASQFDYQPVTLGHSTLRMETAVLVAVALAKMVSEEFANQ